jgi:hypothetical protein
MWHSIEHVIKDRRLNPELAQAVAKRDAAIFAIVDGRISTWTVDAFVDAVRLELSTSSDCTT